MLDQPYDLIVTSLVFLTAWVTGNNSRTRRAYLDEIAKQARRAETDLDQERARAAFAERVRIARELHDVVAHHVSVIAVQAEAAGSLLPGRPERAADSVQIIAATARQALTELRRLLGVLRNPDEPMPTTPAASLAHLDALLERVRDSGLATEMTVTGSRRHIPDTVDLTAYRIIQEALTNTVRHAGAAQATVTVDYQVAHVNVTVADDGLGAAEGAAVSNGKGLPASGLGLAGIAERVASCGGVLTFGPTSAGGFSVTACLPT